MEAIVKYQIADYSGSIRVVCDGNDDNETIIAKALQELRKTAPLPGGYRHFDVKREASE